MTLHAVKGREFPIVGIAHVEADRLPGETSATHPKEIAEHRDDERRVFYVGCTRARRRLFVTHDRGSPSPLLDELSEEHWEREVGDGGAEKTEANSS
jgi:superfamily I DNA/RNA helicase